MDYPKIYNKLLLQTFLSWLGIAILLFSVAGTLKWWGAWVFIFESAILGLLIGFWLAKHDQGLLKERLAFIIQAEQKGWDKLIMVIFILLFLGWLVLIALDVKYYGFAQLAPIFPGLGVLAIAVSMGFIFLSFRENSYAAPVVKIQKDRNHKVISTGLYAYVRHPMYSGALFYFLGVPLVLGSWRGLVLSFCLIILMAIRAYLEEKTLMNELEGYSAYMKKVPYRLIPYLW